MSHYTTPLKFSFLAALLLMVMARAAVAQPSPINYQGYLAQPDGTPIDTTVSIGVELWTAAAAGTLLYSESQATVPVSKGRFSIEIGTGTPLSGTFNADQFLQETWLALTINGELLTPRSRLGATAGSQHAEIAERLSTSCTDGEWIGYRGGQLACYECFGGSKPGCYDGPPGTNNVGQCTGGAQACTEGLYGGVCTGQVLPGAETCDGTDEDCNGLVDDGTSLPGCIDLYSDADGDGFGDALSLSCICGSNPPGSGTTNVGGDCDDTDINARPDQTSYFGVASNGGTFDYNCNGTIDKLVNSPVATCTYNGSTCDYVAGFSGSNPACGTFGFFSAGCSQSGTVCTVITGATGANQLCR